MESDSLTVAVNTSVDHVDSCCQHNQRCKRKRGRPRKFNTCDSTPTEDTAKKEETAATEPDPEPFYIQYRRPKGRPKHVDKDSVTTSLEKVYAYTHHRAFIPYLTNTPYAHTIISWEILMVKLAKQMKQRRKQRRKE